jgi:hypothetical protein
VEAAQAIVAEGSRIARAAEEEMPSKAWVGEAMCEARAPAVPQAVAVVPAEEAVVAVLVQEAVVVGAAAVVVVGVGKKLSRSFACSRRREIRCVIQSEP